MSAPLRLGLVWPGGGAEHEYYAFAETLDDRIKVFLAPSRVGGSPGHDHDLAALADTGRIDWILEAARRLTPLRPDVVFWACTSGSFVGGRAHALEQVEALSEEMGVPAGSTSLAIVAALAALGASRVSVLATYPEPATDAFTTFLDECGVEVTNATSLGALSGWAAALTDPELIVSSACETLSPRAQALVVPDTALPTLGLVARMEKALGKPVITANAASLWQAMHLAGRSMPTSGHGILLEGVPGRDDGAG